MIKELTVLYRQVVFPLCFIFWPPPLLAVSSVNDFGTVLFEASSTWVPSESSYKKQTTRNYSTSSKKALVARYTEREICKHDPYKKVAEMRSSDSLALDPNGELQGSLMARGASLSLL